MGSRFAETTGCSLHTAAQTAQLVETGLSRRGRQAYARSSHQRSCYGWEHSKKQLHREKAIKRLPSNLCTSSGFPEAQQREKAVFYLHSASAASSAQGISTWIVC